MEDSSIRLAAFDWLEEQNEKYNDVLPRSVLENGFLYRNERITLVGPKGIWKPKVMELPLSITSMLNGPYNDQLTVDDYMHYKYRGTDPNHSDNVGLRDLMMHQTPLIYFHNVLKGKYIGCWPVYIVGDDQSDLTFTVALDDKRVLNQVAESFGVEEEEVVYRKKYVTSQFKTRLHQRSFRERVLTAYQSQCAICRLRHRELLDAAHITADKEDEGEPIVQNGISLCKIHHAAYDSNIIGIRPDYLIEVRQDVLKEIDGPMLKYGLQSVEGNKLILPRSIKNRPDQERLDIRYSKFKKAG